MFFSYRNWSYGLCVILSCVTSGGLFWHLDLTWSKMHLAFLSISWYHLILRHSLKMLLIFWKTSNIFQVEGWFWLFWLKLVCSTMDRGFECFFRKFCHIFPWVTTLVITHVTICLWVFCTIFNTLALLVHYQMCYCVPYYIFSVK